MTRARRLPFPSARRTSLSPRDIRPRRKSFNYENANSIVHQSRIVEEYFIVRAAIFNSDDINYSLFPHAEGYSAYRSLIIIIITPEAYLQQKMK